MFKLFTYPWAMQEIVFGDFILARKRRKAKKEERKGWINMTKTRMRREEIGEGDLDRK